MAHLHSVLSRRKEAQEVFTNKSSYIKSFSKTKDKQFKKGTANRDSYYPREDDSDQDEAGAT